MLTDAQIQEGNRLIADYMGFSHSIILGQLRWADWDGMKPILYHDDWNWQIPVWSKLQTDIANMYDGNLRKWSTDKLDAIYDEWNQFNEFYYGCLKTNSPQHGFTLILELLNWYKNNKV